MYVCLSIPLLVYFLVNLNFQNVPSKCMLPNIVSFIVIVFATSIHVYHSSFFRFTSFLYISPFTVRIHIICGRSLSVYLFILMFFIFLIKYYLSAKYAIPRNIYIYIYKIQIYINTY